MAEFMVDIWDGSVENRHVTIEDFSTIKGWGTPIGTVTAILTKARWGECADMPGDYRRRSDAMTINGDGGIWEGTMGGRHFRIRNLAFFPQEEKKRRKKSDAYQEARAGRVVDQPIAYQGVNIAPGRWQVVEGAPANAPAAFWYDAVQPQPVNVMGNVNQQAGIGAAQLNPYAAPQMDQAAYEAAVQRMYGNQLQDAEQELVQAERALDAAEQLDNPVQEDEH